MYLIVVPHAVNAKLSVLEFSRVAKRVRRLDGSGRPN